MSAVSLAPSLERPPAEPRAPVPEPRIPEPDAVRKALGLGRGTRVRRRIVWLVVLLATAGAAAYAIVRFTAPAPPLRWLTAPVTRADLTTTVTATGALAPVRTVDVSAEISGRIVRVAAAENDHVALGQVLVEIDTERLQSELAQARAQAAVALATTRDARATLSETRGDLNRALALSKKGVTSDSNLAASRAAYARAQAHVASSAAQELLAAAQVASVETDLGKAIIVAPIDGVVLTRSVEPGNAVAATFQAPVLMIIAADLASMELELDIDEADVAVVKAGQAASFTVDAYPDRTFPATVLTVLFASKTVSNVVTYPARLSVDNHERLLRPGMTATAVITTGVERQALTLPNAALRFSPPSGAGAGRTMFSGPGGGGAALTPAALAAQNAPRVYVLQDGQPLAVEVTPGASDGQRTVVQAAALPEGTRVVVAQDRSEAP